MTQTGLSPSEVNSRFKVLPRPFPNPGKCAVCGGVKTSVVDFGLTVQFYGAVMICTVCLSEAARKIGMVSERDLVDNVRATDQIAKEYLARNNLKAINGDQYSLAVTAATSLSDLVLRGLPDLPVESPANPEQDSGRDPNQLDLFESIDSGSALDNGSTISVEGRADVSDDTFRFFQ